MSHQNCPAVAETWPLSVSGGGLFAFATYEGTPDLKTLLAAMQADFRYKIDKACSDLSRLRFVSFDENLILKEKVCPAILVEQTESVEDIDDAEPLQRVPFPVECLPSTLARWVSDTQRCIGLKDPSMPAISALAAISGIIGSTCRIEIKKGYTEHAALFTAIIGDSGFAKSPSIAAALRHLNYLEAARVRKWQREDYEWNQKYHMSSRTSLKPPPTESQEEEPKPPQPADRYIIKDATIEAVAPILCSNPPGLLLYRDELNGFFAGMDSYHKASTDLQSWIEIYECRGLTIDRKQAGTLHIDNPSVAIIGGIQNEVLQQTLRKRPDFIHSGFGSRFLFVMPEKEAIIWNHNTPDTQVIRNYENLIDCIIADREKVVVKDQTEIKAFAMIYPFVFTLSGEARQVLFEFQAKNAKQAVYEDAANAAAMNKAGRIAARLCLTLHCVQSIEDTGQLLGQPVISKWTAKNAVALADWFMRETERVYAMLAGKSVTGELTPEQKEIMKKIQQHDGEATTREIRQSDRSHQKQGGPERLEKMLHEMVAAGLLESEFVKSTKGGPGKQVYRIPVVYGTPENTGKNGSSGHVDITENDEFENKIESESVVPVYETQIIAEENGECVDADTSESNDSTKAESDEEDMRSFCDRINKEERLWAENQRPTTHCYSCRHYDIRSEDEGLCCAGKVQHSTTNCPAFELYDINEMEIPY